MNRIIPAALIIAVAMAAVLTAATAEGQEPESRTAGTVRQPADTVGYATSPGQMDVVVTLSDSLIEAGALPFVLPFASSGAGTMIGAIVPHDDYIYAGPYYAMTFDRVGADLVVLFGVAHRARRIGLQGRLTLRNGSP